MKKLLLFFFAIVAVLLTMYVTCPSEKQHKDAISESCYLALKEKAGSAGGLLTGLISTLSGVDADGMSRQVVDYMVGNMVSVDNYYGLVSVGTFTYNGRSQKVSIGIFGHVFAPSKDDVVKLIDKHWDRL